MSPSDHGSKLLKSCAKINFPPSNWFTSGICHSGGKLTHRVCSRLLKSILSISGIRGFVPVQFPAFSAPSLSTHTAIWAPFINTLRFSPNTCLFNGEKNKAKQGFCVVGNRTRAASHAQCPRFKAGSPKTTIKKLSRGKKAFQRG